jgi:hypothetical protein
MYFMVGYVANFVNFIIFVAGEAAILDAAPASIPPPSNRSSGKRPGCPERLARAV